MGAIKAEADEHRERTAKVQGDPIKNLMLDDHADEVRKMQELHAEAHEHREKMQKEHQDLHENHASKLEEVANHQEEVRALKDAVKAVNDDAAVKKVAFELE